MMSTRRAHELSVHLLAFLEEQEFWVTKWLAHGDKQLPPSQFTMHCHPTAAGEHRPPALAT